MTREEILKAAIANANGQNPVELAKQMQEFLDGEPKPQPKQSAIANYEAAMKRTEEVMGRIAEAKNDPSDEFYIDRSKVVGGWQNLLDTHPVWRKCRTLFSSQR